MRSRTRATSTFPETGEERYHSFLGVPVVERKKPLGVLVVQTLRRRRFSATSCGCCARSPRRSAASSSRLRLLESLQSKEKERHEYRAADGRRDPAPARLREAAGRRSARRRRAVAHRAGSSDVPAAPGLRHRRARTCCARGQLRPGRGAAQPTTPPASGSAFAQARRRLGRGEVEAQGAHERPRSRVRWRASSTPTG